MKTAGRVSARPVERISLFDAAGARYAHTATNSST